MTDVTIAVLEGDGIGPEVVRAAVAVGRAVTSAAGLGVEFPTGLIGGAAIEARGSALPPETVELCRRAQAVLLGAVGGTDDGCCTLATWAECDPRPKCYTEGPPPLKPFVAHRVFILI